MSITTDALSNRLPSAAAEREKETEKGHNGWCPYHPVC